MEKDSIYKFNQETLEAIKEAEKIAKHTENYKLYNNFQEILDEMKKEEQEEKQ